MQLIKFTIDILQEHIDKGTCVQSQFCAIALAFKPFIFSRYFNTVGVTKTRIVFNEIQGVFVNSHSICSGFESFVYAFDQNKNVTPTTVQVWFKKSDFDHIPDLQEFIDNISYMEMEIEDDTKLSKNTTKDTKKQAKIIG